MNALPNKGPMPGPAAASPSGQVVWESRPGWGTFRTGLLLMILGVGLGYLVLLGLLVTFLAALSAVSKMQAGNMQQLPTAADAADTASLLMLMWACSGLGALWVFTGFVVAAPTPPRESGASPWGLLAFFALLAAFVIQGALTVDSMRRGGEALGVFAGLLRDKSAPKPEAVVKLVVDEKKLLSPETFLYLNYALLVCVALAKVAFTLALWQVARFFGAHGLAFSVALYLFLLVCAATFVVLAATGRIPVNADGPKEAAKDGPKAEKEDSGPSAGGGKPVTGGVPPRGGLLALVAVGGGFVFSLWLFFNLLSVHATVTQGLLRREASPAA